MNYEVVIVEDDELPIESGWVIACTSVGVFLMVTRSRYAAPGLGAAWLAWVQLGGLPVIAA